MNKFIQQLLREALDPNTPIEYSKWTKSNVPYGPRKFYRGYGMKDPRVKRKVEYWTDDKKIALTYGRNIDEAMVELAHAFIWDGDYDEFNQTNVVAQLEDAFIKARETGEDVVIRRFGDEYTIPRFCDGIIITNIIDPEAGEIVGLDDEDEDAFFDRFQREKDRWASTVAILPVREHLIQENGHEYSEADSEFMENFDKINDTIIKNAEEIRSILLKMFPNAKDVINYHYNDEDGMPFAEWRGVIYKINKWKLIGPQKIGSTQLEIPKEDFNDRQKKYNDYIEAKDKGEHVNYFRNNPSDPRTIDFSKLPPITVRKISYGYEIMDGMHRAFLAKMNNKPLNAYIWLPANNDSQLSRQIVSMFKNIYKL